MSLVEPGLRFRVLGELTAELDGRPLDLGPRLQRQLLAILLSENGRIIAVDRLIDLLWSEEPPSAAIASLQAYISQLRRILEPDRVPRAPARVLVTADPGYSLRIDAEQIDAHRFERLVADGRALLDQGRPSASEELLSSALELWRGGVLVEFANEQWALPMIARLDEARDTAVEDRIDAWLALGRHSSAASELEEMVQQRPLRERRWAQLILAHYRAGRQADALRAYQRCRQALGEELGIDPSPELRKLEAAVLGQDASLDLPPPSPSRPAGGESTGEGGRAAAGESLSAVGRDGAHALHRQHLDRVTARIGDAFAGRGGAVVLVGEPGVGKTTLAEQAANLTVQAGAAVVWTRCLDPNSSPAFWPWLQMLRRLAASASVDAALQRLEGNTESGGGRAALFGAYEAVLDAVREGSTSQPLLIVVDDLHAADSASLDLLELLAGDLPRLPVVIVATLRDTEPSAALSSTLGELLRHRGVERLVIPALELGEVAALAEQISGASLHESVTAALYERTGGNIFYLTELLRLLGAEHRKDAITAAAVHDFEVPSGVRDVILRRTDRLPANTRTLLTISSVVGRDADLDLLEQAAGLDSEQLLLALEPAIAAGLLVPFDSGWGYRFRHPLIQESIYAGISTVERARLHARIAAALEAVSDPDAPAQLAALAFHWAAAGPLGDPARAVDYLRRAADLAARAGAWADAVRLLEQALAVPNTSGRPQLDARIDVLVDLGRVHRQAGSIPQSHVALYEAVRLADQRGDEDRVLEAAVAFGAVAIWGSREWGETDHRLVDVLERQLRRLDPVDVDRRVRILSTLAGELYFGPDAPRGWDYAQQALELGRASNQTETLGIAVSGYLLSALANDRLPERAHLIEELLNEPRLGIDAEAVVRTNLLTERLRYGNMAAFDGELPGVRHLATDVLHSRELEGQLLLLESCRASLTGDTVGATRIAGQGFSVLDSPTWAEPSEFVLESSLLLVSHQLADKAEELEARLLDPRHPSVPHLAAPAAALGYAQRGDSERAREIAERWFAPPPQAWTWIQPVAYWAQVAALLGAPDVEWLHQALTRHSGELALVGIGADSGGAVDSLLAGLLLRQGRPAEALEKALAGQALERRAGMPQWHERTAALVRAAQADAS